MPVIGPKPKPHRSPTFWFVRLELSLEEGDWDEAARAARELLSLGFDVRIVPRKTADTTAGGES
jgi:hypothetical protein